MTADTTTTNSTAVRLRIIGDRPRRTRSRLLVLPLSLVLVLAFYGAVRNLSGLQRTMVSHMDSMLSAEAETEAEPRSSSRSSSSSSSMESSSSSSSNIGRSTNGNGNNYDTTNDDNDNDDSPMITAAPTITTTAPTVAPTTTAPTTTAPTVAPAPPPTTAPTKAPTTTAPTTTPTTTTPTTPTTKTIIRHERLIHDTTLFWNETMHRPWLDTALNTATTTTTTPAPTPKPPMLLLTTVGWNHPNQAFGLTVSRFLRERELFTAIVNHPWFHPTAWQDIQSGKMEIASDQNYYVFSDITQCREMNYPNYGGAWQGNRDGEFNRTGDDHNLLQDHCRGDSYEILQHKLFVQQKENNEKESNDNNNNNNDNTTTNSNSNNNSTTNQHHNATLLLFHCGSEGTDKACTQIRLERKTPVAIAMIDGTFPNLLEDRDQGLAPPSPNHATLTPQEEDDIRTCRAEQDSHRYFHHVYLGNFRSGRNAAFNSKWEGSRYSYYKEGFHDNNHTIIMNPPDHKKYPSDSIIANMTYTEVLRNTRFGLAPRGDNNFSYRFTEVLSAGAILVFHGDNYLFPFRPELIDWGKCAITLPERDAGIRTMNAMNRVSARERCQRRNYCYFEIYKKYVQTTSKQIGGLVGGLELVAKRGGSGQRAQPRHHGIRCDAASIANHDCNNM